MSSFGVDNFFIFVILCFMLKESSEQATYSDGLCSTPNNARGICIRITECPTLLRLLRQKPRPPGAEEFLRNSQCGVEGRAPKVCCQQQNSGNANRRTPMVDTSYPYYREHPPNINNHPNLRLLPNFCGDGDENKLSGGNLTGVFEFPWMALLSYRNGRRTEFKCGGAIIHEKYILTAAHCIIDSLLNVRVGEHDISTSSDCEYEDTDYVCADPYQDIAIEQAIKHPLYVGGRGRSARYQHDIALIRLRTPIVMKDSVKPICLPITSELQELQTDGKKMIVAGWGITENSIYNSNVLLKIAIPTVENIECGRRLNGSVADGIGFRQMCAGSFDNPIAALSCKGDSGGPLKFTGMVNGILRYIVYGIVSFGSPECGTYHIPSVFTRVPFYMDWILDNIRS